MREESDHYSVCFIALTTFQFFFFWSLLSKLQAPELQGPRLSCPSLYVQHLGASFKKYVLNGWVEKGIMLSVLFPRDDDQLPWASSAILKKTLILDMDTITIQPVRLHIQPTFTRRPNPRLNQWVLLGKAHVQDFPGRLLSSVLLLLALALSYRRIFFPFSALP